MPNYMNIFISKKVFNKVKKQYLVMFIVTVTIRTQIFIPSFYKFELPFKAALLSMRYGSIA
jgi:hypothetical protein